MAIGREQRSTGIEARVGRTSDQWEAAEASVVQQVIDHERCGVARRHHPACRWDQLQRLLVNCEQDHTACLNTFAAAK